MIVGNDQDGDDSVITAHVSIFTWVRTPTPQNKTKQKRKKKVKKINEMKVQLIVQADIYLI